MTKRIIHFDLDGVLADFCKGFMEIAGKRPEAFGTDDMWAYVASAPEFFLRLEVMPGTKEMLHLAASMGEVRILTAIPRKTTYPAAEDEKRQWVARHFGDISVTVVQYARQKADHAMPADILIDDAEDNIRRWIRAGGIGIHYVDAVEAADELRRLCGP
jgi:5'(3')-deoxyribonucleotidase